MAEQRIADPGKTYTDAFGTVWNQVTYRRLTSGEYVRFMAEDQGRRLLMQHGKAAGPIVEWLWEVPLSPEDAICLLGDTAYGLLVSDRVTGSIVGAAVGKITDLEGKLEAAMLENKALKDKEG